MPQAGGKIVELEWLAIGRIEVRSLADFDGDPHMRTVSSTFGWATKFMASTRKLTISSFRHAEGRILPPPQTKRSSCSRRRKRKILSVPWEEVKMRPYKFAAKAVLWLPSA